MLQLIDRVGNCVCFKRNFISERSFGVLVSVQAILYPGPRGFLLMLSFLRCEALIEAPSWEKKKASWSHFHACSALNSCQRCHFLLTNHKGGSDLQFVTGPGGSVLRYSEINYFVGRGEERLQAVKLRSCFHS